MRTLMALCFGLSTIASAALAETTARCPHSGSEDCDAWELARVDNELAALLAGPSTWIDRMPEGLRAGARAALVEAQVEWIKFREAECQRELTWSYMTARTRRGFLANCALNMTDDRRKKLQRDYSFKED